MPYKLSSDRKRAAAAGMKRLRLYRQAVAAGHPKALAAEAARSPMKPANDALAEIERLPSREARQARKAEYMVLLAKCQAIDPDQARATYLKLRAEVIAELEAFS
jgi:hypothetical protein